MAQLRQNPITNANIDDFIQESDDFAFEMRVLQELNLLSQCDTEHGGTYQDPVTDKPRQFDIRAHIHLNSGINIRMAVECKNLRDNFPLVISIVPRTKREAKHSILYVNEGNQVFVLDGGFYYYPEGESVGKSCTQVGIDKSGNFVGGDAGIYDKWAQAIHSCYDLILKACKSNNSQYKEVYSLILPVLVVPDGTLWQVEYDPSGGLETGAAKVDHVSHYIDKPCYVERLGSAPPVRFNLSHIEIVTQKGLKDLSRLFTNVGQSECYEQINAAFTTAEQEVDKRNLS